MVSVKGFCVAAGIVLVVLDLSACGGEGGEVCVAAGEYRCSYQVRDTNCPTGTPLPFMGSHTNKTAGWCGEYEYFVHADDFVRCSSNCLATLAAQDDRSYSGAISCEVECLDGKCTYSATANCDRYN